MSDIPTPETYNLAPWPNETGYDATPTLRCKWCNGVGNMKPLPRKYEEGSLEPGFLAPAAICPRCKGSGLDPDCAKEEIRKGVRLSKSPATKWYVTDYPVEGSFAVTDGYEIFAQIIGGKTVGDECDLASRIAKLPDLERELAEAREKIKRQAERICQLEGATNHAGGTPLSIALRERDEARADAARLADILSGLELRSTEDLARLEQERNEARAVADELASVAAHCLGWHDHESPDAAIKIAAALKRWKKNK